MKTPSEMATRLIRTAGIAAIIDAAVLLVFIIDGDLFDRISSLIQTGDFEQLADIQGILSSVILLSFATLVGALLVVLDVHNFVDKRTWHTRASVDRRIKAKIMKNSIQEGFLSEQIVTSTHAHQKIMNVFYNFANEGQELILQLVFQRWAWYWACIYLFLIGLIATIFSLGVQIFSPRPTPYYWLIFVPATQSLLGVLGLYKIRSSLFALADQQVEQITTQNRRAVRDHIRIAFDSEIAAHQHRLDTRNVPEQNK